MILQKINDHLDKAMPLITPASVIIGVIFAATFKSYSYLVPWIFAFMTFSGSLSSNFSSFKRSLSRPLPIIIVLVILHVIMPIWAWILGHVVFSGDTFTITGLILATVIPTGITSFIWVSIYKGNIALTLCIIIIDTLLSPFLIPYSLSILIGQSVVIDVWGMMQGLFLMIVIPSLCGMMLNQLTSGRLKNTLGLSIAPFSKLGVMIIIMINGAVVSPYFINMSSKLLTIAFVVLAISCLGYAISWLVGAMAKLEKDEIVTLMFTGGMRNISVGAVLAISFFPEAVAVPVVLGILFQQLIASLYGYLLSRFYFSIEKNVQTKQLEG